MPFIVQAATTYTNRHPELLNRLTQTDLLNEIFESSWRSPHQGHQPASQSTAEKSPDVATLSQQWYTQFRKMAQFIYDLWKTCGNDRLYFEQRFRKKLPERFQRAVSWEFVRDFCWGSSGGGADSVRGDGRFWRSRLR
ncbi:hypothetical protein [Leptolyngbya sp. O-77]|uniref:hypothetical protein n=1 Tax=Leptolyngbya sp. O-77 TaxID=1080068 RepID=UPI0012E3E09D|nr:hypothetical protein [Leptolyngbya sp. O-77]